MSGFFKSVETLFNLAKRSRVPQIKSLSYRNEAVEPTQLFGERANDSKPVPEDEGLFERQLFEGIDFTL